MGVEDEVISIRKKLEKYQEKGKFQNRCFFAVFLNIFCLFKTLNCNNFNFHAVTNDVSNYKIVC
jgi:hypothetical protein